MIITLLDGTSEDTANIFFDPDTYHFSDTLTGADLTFNLKLTDKQSFPSFNTQKWFDIASTLKNPGSGTGTGVPAGETPKGTLATFWDQITTDPLAAPLDAANKGFNKLIAAPVAYKVAAVVVIGALLLYALRSKKG